MARPKKDKSPYEDLPQEWKDSVAAKSISEINDEIAVIAKRQEENSKSMKDDPDLENLKWQVKEASAPYREAAKANKLKIQYAIEMLEAKGGK
jgi:hypothetical protein